MKETFHVTLDFMCDLEKKLSGNSVRLYVGNNKRVEHFSFTFFPNKTSCAKSIYRVYDSDADVSVEYKCAEDAVQFAADQLRISYDTLWGHMKCNMELLEMSETQESQEGV